ALLGWNPGTEEELFELEDLVALFELERVQKSGARFDPEKTKWFNQQYLQKADNSSLLEGFKSQILLSYPDVEAALVSDISLLKIIDMVKERAVFAADLVSLSSFLFQAPDSYEEKAVKKQWKEQSPNILKDVLKLISNEKDFKGPSLEAAVKGYISDQELSFGAVMPPLRLALVGALSGPNIFDIMEVIGAPESQKRLKKIIETLA
ncbi:MAG: glutamate--tRNA ligase, partial [Flavobacteriaceae bacterium]